MLLRCAALKPQEDILLDTASVGDNGDVGVPDPEETQLPTEAGPWAFPQSAAMDSLAEENRVRVVAVGVLSLVHGFVGERGLKCRRLALP